MFSSYFALSRFSCRWKIIHKFYIKCTPLSKPWCYLVVVKLSSFTGLSECTLFGIWNLELKFYHVFSITVGCEVDNHIIRYEQWKPVPGKGFCKCLNSATNNVSAIVKKGKNKQDIIWISLLNKISMYF